MSLTAWLAIAGVSLSLGLASLRIWEAFFLQPQIVVSFDWLEAANGSALMWFAANVGRRRAILKEVRFLTASDTDEQGHQWAPALAERVYPCVLDSHDATPVVTMVEALAGEEATASDLRRLLRDGRIIRCVVETLGKRGVRRWTFDVPPKPHG